MIEVTKNFLVPDVGVNDMAYLSTRGLLVVLAKLDIVKAFERNSTNTMFVGFIVKIGSPNGTRTRFP